MLCLISNVYASVTIGNTANLDVAKDVDSTSKYAVTFTTPAGDSFSLNYVILPLTRPPGWHGIGNISDSLMISIYPCTAGVPNTTDLALTTTYIIASNLVGSVNTTENIHWMQAFFTIYNLTAGTTYAIVVSYPGAVSPNVFNWWANSNYTSYTNGTSYHLVGSTWTAYGGGFQFGFQITSGTWNEVNPLIPWTYVPPTGTGTEFTNMFLGIFFSLALGCVGFGMSKGKEPMVALAMIYMGLFVSYMVSWIPMWIVVSALAVLGIVFADKFRGVLRR